MISKVKPIYIKEYYNEYGYYYICLVKTKTNIILIRKCDQPKKYNFIKKLIDKNIIDGVDHEVLGEFISFTKFYKKKDSKLTNNLILFIKESKHYDKI